MDIIRDIEVKQASDFFIELEHEIGGQPLAGLNDIEYIIFNRSGIQVTKKLGDGISWNDVTNTITIHVTHQDILELSGTFNHECAVMDIQSNKTFVLRGRVRITNTTLRF